MSGGRGSVAEPRLLGDHELSKTSIMCPITVAAAPSTSARRQLRSVAIRVVGLGSFGGLGNV